MHPTSVGPNSERPSLDGRHFDLVVIGGGINGVAIARECARAGCSVLLIEQNDLASGTTSRSTRIIHGGLRYLQYAEISLVRESLRERDRLLAERPHLVRPLQFILAIDQHSRPSALQVRAGLWLYARLARQHWYRPHDRNSLRALEAQLDAGRNWSLFDYDDAQCEFPERLVAEWACDACASGVTISTYTAALDVVRTNGRATGVRCRDRLSGREFSISCKWVINASGPWVDQVCGASGISTGGRLIGGVRGSHLVLPRFPGAPQTALYTQGIDARPIFLIPWNEQLLLGTTEIPDAGDPTTVAPSDFEIDYLIHSLNALFPQARLSRADVRYAFSGIRPLPFVKDAAPSAITRKSILHDHRHDGVEGMISVIGGKLTTAASVARKCAEAIGLRTPAQVPIPIGVASGLEDTVRQWARAISRNMRLPESLAAQTASMYGPRALTILRSIGSAPSLAQPLCDHTSHVVGEAVYAFRSEFAVTLGDVLLRRVPVALGPCWSAECTRMAAGRIGAALGWNERYVELQAESAEMERQAFLRCPPAPADSSQSSQRLA